MDDEKKLRAKYIIGGIVLVFVIFYLINNDKENARNKAQGKPYYEYRRR
ncbi:hypothetical protein [Dysgonomonas mossii]